MGKKLFYYISSAINVLKFNRKLPNKPEAWYGPFSKKEAEEMQKIMKTNVESSKERMKINRER